MEISWREGIIKCHHRFDATWGQDAILLLAAGQRDAFALLAGVFISASPHDKKEKHKKIGDGGMKS